MESKALTELRFRSWNSYISSLKQNATESKTLGWEKRLPVGRSRLEHYNQGASKVVDLISTTVSDPSLAVLLIPTASMPWLALSENFHPNQPAIIKEAYQVGTLGDTAVVVDLSVNEDEMLLIDISTDKATLITLGKYDYEADLASLKKEFEEGKM